MNLMMYPKILTDAMLPARLAAWRSADKTIVFTNGCFDILHPGHVDLLARAKALADVLILGINTDESVRRLGKGEDRPINPLCVRAFVLAHLESVDAVIPFAEETPLHLVSQILPDILVKGGDWNINHIVGREIVEEHGGKVLSLPLLAGYSTTALVQRIRRQVSPKQPALASSRK